MLLKLDAFLLRQMQKFCDRLQALTSLTKFFVEKCLIIAAAGVAWVGQGPTERPWTLVLLVCAGTLLFATFKAESGFLKRGALVRSILPESWMRIAACIVLIIPYPNLSWGHNCYGIFLGLYLYVNACIPRPPRTQFAPAPV